MNTLFPLLLQLLVVPDSMASELVLYGSQETEDTARAKVALFGGRTLANLKAETLTSLYSGSTLVPVGGATLTACEGEPSGNAMIQEIVEATESSVLFMEFETAKESLNRAVALERCLSEPIDAEIASRVHYLRAMVAVGSGDQASAWPEFVQAATLKPDITWDENFPPDGRTAFKGAVAAMKVAEPLDFHLVPPPDQTLWVNGIQQEDTTSLALRPGSHVVQLGDSDETLSTYVIELPEATRAALLFPSELKDDRVDWASSGDTRVRLEAILAANCQGSIAYVSLPGQVLWQFDPGTWQWTPLSGVSEEEAAAMASASAAAQSANAPDSAPDGSSSAAPSPTDSTTKPSSSLTTGLRYGGAGLAVTGGIVAGIGYSQMQSATNDTTEQTLFTTAQKGAIHDRHSTGARNHVIGLVLAGVGVSGTASSLFIDSSRGPRVTAAPGSVVFHGQW